MGSLLCHKSRSDELAYKKEGEFRGCLIYKSTYVNVYISWGTEHKDLDICAYWFASPQEKVGFSYQRSMSSGVYKLTWYGDDTGYGGSEKLLPYIMPWSSSADHRLRVHFNWYPTAERGIDYPCTVKVTSADGKESLTMDNVSCSSRGGAAKTQDKFVDIMFDAQGRAEYIEQDGRRVSRND